MTTSTDRGSVAVAEGSKILGSAAWTRKTHGSEILTLKIRDLLSKLRLKPSDLQGLAVDRGPGSFTGCRIAANVAKTMALSLDIPVAAVPSLDALAWAAAPGHKGRILSVLDAHKSLLFAKFYDSDGQKPSLDGGAITAESLGALAAEAGKDVLAVGEIPPDAVKSLKAAGARRPARALLNFPNARSLLQLVHAQGPEIFGNWRDVEPIYIRAPDAVEKFERAGR